MTVTPERRGIGCLGSVVGLAVLVALVVAGLFVGLIVLGVVAALMVLGLLALAVDRLLLALSPRRRERRANLQRSLFFRAGMTPPGPVIDAEAHVEDPGARPPLPPSGPDG